MFEKMARLIAGDFNMDFVGKNNRSSDKVLLTDMETSLNLKQLIKEPTRYTAKSSSIIDLIFLSSKVLDSVSIATTINYNVSDHDITYLVFKKDLIFRQKVSFNYRCMKNYKLAILHYRLSSFVWNEFYNADSPTACWNLLYDVYATTLSSVVD